MNLHLMRLQPDPTALAAWAARHGLLSPDGDYGYAFHALLRAAFGDLAPKPFRYLDGKQGFLAYVSAPVETLRLNASLAAPDVARALGLDALDARPFPTIWQSGQHLGFEVRVRPVVRTNGGRERDAFLHSFGNGSVSGTPTDEGSIARRSAIYADWLSSHLAAEDAAKIIEAHLDAFRLTRVLRKAAASGGMRREVLPVTGPDVVYKGVIQVGSGEAFARLLARGVGRHRAFGFGMLLLRPATTC